MSNTNPVQFMQQVRAEVAKVAWPSRREVMLTTVMVFILSALTATFFTRLGCLMGPSVLYLALLSVTG